MCVCCQKKKLRKDSGDIFKKYQLLNRIIIVIRHMHTHGVSRERETIGTAAFEECWWKDDEEQSATGRRRGESIVIERRRIMCEETRNIDIAEGDGRRHESEAEREENSPHTHTPEPIDGRKTRNR